MAGPSESQGAPKSWSSCQGQEQSSSTGTQLVLRGKEGWSARSLALAGGVASACVLWQGDATLGTKQHWLLVSKGRAPTVLDVR